tara:strand:- start:1587 stop:1829 length:243 start_codon:yes stop_codon:yes gene_type:complete
MKTFKDLKFKTHTLDDTAICCYIEFKNGEWISVIGGGRFYGDGVVSFEVMSSSTKNTMQGVKGYLSKKQVSNHMRYLQKK